MGASRELVAGVRGWPAAILAGVLCTRFLNACGDLPVEDVVPERLDPLEHAITGESADGVLHRLGSDGSDDRPWFDFILAARVGRSGEVIGVLTQGEPHVSIFHDGELVARFLRQGDAAGEARNPRALALSLNEREVAVVDPRTARLSVFSVDGELGRYVRLEDRPPLLVQAGCQGGWFVIAPDRNQSLPREVAYWVPELLDGPLSAALVDSTDQTHLIGPGGPATILDVGDRMVIEYGWSAEPQIAEIDCAGELLRKADRPITEDIRHRINRAERAAVGEQDQGLIAAGHWLPAGFLHNRDWTVISGSWWEALRPDEIVTWTELLVHQRGELVRRVVLPFRLRIWDRQPGVGVLLSINEPFPQVILIEDAAWWQWILPADARAP